MADECAAGAMPLELAIQRELAYRRKLAVLQLKPGNVSLKEIPLPAKVQYSSPSPIPKPWAGPSSSASPSSSISGTKRKEPTSTMQYRPFKQQQPFTGTILVKKAKDQFYCKVCKVHCSGEICLEQHLKGKSHIAKLQKRQAHQQHWCNACKMLCPSDNLVKHWQSQEHKAKVQEVNFIRKSTKQFPNPQKFCDLCQVWCTDETSFKQHVKGKKHSLALEGKTALEMPH